MQRPKRKFLREAERIFAATEEAAVLMDSRFVVLALNEAHSRATGYSPSGLIGQRSLVANAILARRKLNREVARALDAFGIWQGEILIPHRTNGYCRVDVLLRDIRDTTRSECSYLAVFSEVSDPTAAGRPLDADWGAAAVARDARIHQPASSE